MRYSEDIHYSGNKYLCNIQPMSNQSIEEVFGRLLKKYREDKKLSKHELSNRCGVDRSMIRKIEIFETQPSLRILLKLGRGLNILPSTMVKDLENRKPKID